VRWTSRLFLAVSSVAALLVSATAAVGDEPTDLLFFSGDLMSARSYAGVGWLHAASGLDFSGPVFLGELGRSQFNNEDGQVAAGWRFAQSHLWLTVMAGAEIDALRALTFRPLVWTDLWWEPANLWMATAQLQATPDYLSWRVAAGRKPADGWPWIGPEAGASAGEPRVGLHATGLRLGAGFEARASAGVSWWEGRVAPYAELSVWRRF